MSSAPWTPIGAEKTATGYEVAWHVTGADQYACGTPTATAISSRRHRARVGTSSSRCKSLESSFHQDLNGDGTIGLHTTVIETHGSTSLAQVANNYFLFPVGGSSGPELSYNGAPVTVGQFGAVDADRRGEDGHRLRGCLARHWGRSIRRLEHRQQRQFPVAAPASCREAVRALQVARTQFPPGPQWRRHDRSPHDGDRVARIDQPGSGREQLFSVSGRRIVGPRAELQRCARDGG